ncbi:MAG: hypothetical protein AABX05_05290 [Nanoarchaeota archaeon]
MTLMRQKRPDKKNALSIVEAAKNDLKFTLSLKVTEASGSTIIRNIYECFRMLGDALLVSKGIESIDHVTQIKELMDLKISTTRPLGVLDNLRRLRHNINYYGYKPAILEVHDTIEIAESCFEPLLKEVLKQLNE